MDVHRDFAQVAVVEDGRLSDAGQIACRPEGLRAWATTLRPDDEVALEATGNTEAIVALIAPRVARVVVSNPMKTRAIAEAKVKTDKVDARILAQLLAADFLPPVWLPDEHTRQLRRIVARRAHLVRQRTRLKNQVQAITARNLLPRPPVSDLFGTRGRLWLQRQELPADERRSVGALLRQLDFHGEELAEVDRELATEGLSDPAVRRLMTVPGIDVAVAVSIRAAVGDFTRFASADKLVAYFGLNPSVHQPAAHGRITKSGRAQVRGMLVEAAWVASRVPGPLRAFHQRIKARRGVQVAIVATARKMTVLCWHLIIKEQDYAFARPSLVAFKQRKLELQAGAPRAVARRGKGYDYNNRELRRHEREIIEQQERAYATLVAHWQPHGPGRSTTAARRLRRPRRSQG
ncbi:IS110 family transposase [Streptomyces sp. NPDC051020]|uniref:IS110 family transposase n=1 Tax=Streptomyces sp. NPDC051020 TaxID=3155409 RepID=UPI0034429E46